MPDYDYALDPETTLSIDPQKRKVRALTFKDPCGKEKGRVAVYCTSGPWYSIPNAFADGQAMNVWHYEISADGKRLTVSPSIGLHAVKGHTQACHLVITNEPFREEKYGE